MDPFLVHLTPEAFAALPQKIVPRTMRLKDPTFTDDNTIEWILGGYIHKLIVKNEPLEAFLAKFLHQFDHPDCRAGLTKGQFIIEVAGALHGQVENGGFPQFLWNCPDRVLLVPEALEALGQSELHALYLTTIDSLVQRQDEWRALHEEAYRSSPPDWAPFEKAYELVDSEAFHAGYFNRLKMQLVKAMLAYIHDHRDEFMVS